ncbi:hypothetical protein BDR04DRAFT_1159614 [Suillus decipiens]|nr:hypothetical protein BDR04DRAFT_1159614 [Suillus decipiens]
MLSLAIVRIQRYFQQCSSITRIHRFLSRAIEFLVNLIRRFRHLSRVTDDEEKASTTIYEVRSLQPISEYIYSSFLPPSPDHKPGESSSPSDIPYDAPPSLATRQQTLHMSDIEPSAEIEIKEPFTDHTPPTSTSPTATTRPRISVNTRSNTAFLSSYPDLSQVSLSPHRMLALAHLHHEPSEPVSRSGSVQSNASRGRNSYRNHDGQISPSSIHVLLHEPRCAPMSASGVKRFDRHARKFAMIDPSISDYKIKAYQVQYPSHDENLPTGWTAHVHPQGARYFLHAQTRTYTESDVCSPDVLNDIVYFSNYLHGELRIAIDTKKIDIEYDDVELVLEPKKAGCAEIVCCYYFVNPAERCLFWLDEYDAEDMLGECRGVTALSHKRLAVQAQYWCASLPKKHWEMFPNICQVTQDILDELKELMLHATCDHLTTTRSAAALGADELKQYFEIVKWIRVNSSCDRAHAVVIIGRLMHTFCRNQYLNFHGQPCARLSVDQTVRDWSYKPSIYMTVFAPLLCMVPVSHLRSLHTSFVDDLASTSEWKIFITRLNGQLQNLNLLGTVLLGANVGFLAIQSVDSGTGRSPTQIASYMSLVLSFGSIALGLMFVTLDLTGKDRGSEASRFLQRMNDGKHGLEKLAMIYSLPYALLIMLFFIVAFSYEWCKPGDAVSRSIVGAVLLTVCGLVVWCISVAADNHAPWWSKEAYGFSTVRLV